MKLVLFKADLNAARNAAAMLMGVLVLSLAANLITLVLLGKSHANVRTILVPPNIDKSFWVEAERVSPEYYEQMTHYLSMLILNVQPGTIEYQNKILRQYVSPALSGSLDNEGRLNALRIRRDNASQLFTPMGYQIDARERRAVIHGQLQTIVNKTPVSNVGKAYLAQFELTSGRLLLASFRETRMDDPFNPDKHAEKMLQDEGRRP